MFFIKTERQQKDTITCMSGEDCVEKERDWVMREEMESEKEDDCLVEEGDKGG